RQPLLSDHDAQAGRDHVARRSKLQLGLFERLAELDTERHLHRRHPPEQHGDRHLQFVREHAMSRCSAKIFAGAIAAAAAGENGENSMRRKPWPMPLRAVALVCATTLVMGLNRKADNLPDRPLPGPSGVTSFSGQVVDLNGHGLPGVELMVGASRTLSDDNGRFLLTYVTPGKTVLQIDGRRAGAKREVDYGYYQARVEAVAGQTTVLPLKSWLPRIDHSHDVTIASPTPTEVVVRSPQMPDFELRIAPGVVIRDVDGQVVTRVGITPVPSDRAPVPVPEHFEVPTIPIIQPGAACLYDARGGVGIARMIFPNFAHELPRARANLWRYEPDGNGWTPYGMGTVSADGRQVVPDAGVVITDFASAECDPATRSRQPLPVRQHVHPPGKMQDKKQ